MIARQTSGGLAYRVRQLTVRELFAFYECPSQRPDGDKGVICEHLVEDMPIYDIPRFTDIELEALFNLIPQEINEIITHIKEANPHFFILRQKERLARALHVQAPTTS